MELENKEKCFVEWIFVNLSLCTRVSMLLTILSVFPSRCGGAVPDCGMNGTMNASVINFTHCHIRWG